ncbi:MAG: BadF/BadG/BcrA/BcrD ATPase family protein, partial [Oscillospiraceae bacterium]
DSFINQLLEPLKISRNQIVSAVFGLAGIDTAVQQEKMVEIISSLGFDNFVAVNDSFLAIKAASDSGSGICSINGTGITVGAIDEDGKTLQIGGIGAAVGDSGGGRYYAAKAICGVYSELFRNGKKTSMTKEVLELLEVNDTFNLMDFISDKHYGRKTPDVKFMKILFQHANMGDEIAINIVTESATEISNSVIGAIQLLQFNQKVDIVTTGSIWDKCETPLLFDIFKEKVLASVENECCFIKPEYPPICGGVNWAFQLLKGKEDGLKFRKKIAQEVVRGLAKS